MKALWLSLTLLVGCSARHEVVLDDGGSRALTPAVDAAADAAIESQPEEDAAAAQTDDGVYHCVIDTYYCDEYHGVPEPAVCTREEGPCGAPTDPSNDICVVGPGHLLYYYHLVIPVEGRDGGIPYGPLPPSNCVHPG